MSAYVSVVLQHQIRDIFLDCCAYCQISEDLTIAIFEFEHILPISAGGETTLDNLCLACPTCNRYKATRQLVVPFFHPQTQLWEEHFSWTDDGTEITSLTPVGRATIVTLKMNRSQLICVRRMWVTMGEHPPKLE